MISATSNCRFLPVLSWTFSALFPPYLYTIFSGNQCKIPLQSVSLRPRHNQKVGAADNFWSFSHYDSNQFR